MADDLFPERYLQTRLKLHQLNFLVAVDETRSLAKAAERMNMSQPAATKALREIEDNLGLRLFERSRRGVTPTPYGVTMIRGAKLVLAELRHLHEELTALKTGIHGRIIVGTLLAGSTTLLPLTLARLRAERPGVSVKIVEGTTDLLLPMLRSGDLDLVIGRLSRFRNREGVAQEALYDEPIAVVARPLHPLVGNESLTLADLAAQSWILPPSETNLRREFDSAFQEAGLDAPVPAIESLSLVTNQRLLAVTDLLGLQHLDLALYHQGLGMLRILPIAIPGLAGPVGISTRLNRPLSPTAQYLVEVLRETAWRITTERAITAAEIFADGTALAGEVQSD